jgi:ABC-type lipoprotein release transport system permease subunit
MLVKYTTRNLFDRRIKGLVAALAVAAVVTVFIALQSVAVGIQTIFDNTGDPLDLMVMQKGSLGDMNQGVDRSVLNIIRELPGIETNSDGRLMVSPEQYVIVYLKWQGTDEGANITVRGVPPEGFDLRPELRLVRGRMFRPGAHEVMVSRFVSMRYEGVSVGNRLHLGHSDWTVVGVFDGGQSIINTEIWADMDELSEEFGRSNFYSLILARAVDRSALRTMIDRITGDPRLNLRAESQNEYARERGRISMVPRALGFLLSLTLAVGASFVIRFVMDDSVLSRLNEIAMLRLIGFGHGRIFVSVLGESLALALVGGLAGSAVAIPLDEAASGAPFMIYREIGFRAQVPVGLVVSGLILACAVGFAGGVLPAWRAARQNGLAAIRNTSL